MKNQLSLNQLSLREGFGGEGQAGFLTPPLRGKKWLTLVTTRFCDVTGMKMSHRMHLRLEVCLEEMAGKGGMVTEIASAGLGFVKSSSLRICGSFCRASNELSRNYWLRYKQ